MAYREIPFVSGDIYHIYNRGVEKRPTFVEDGDRFRFMDSLSYYRDGTNNIRYSLKTRENKSKAIQKPPELLIKIICYCLMPNHYHLLIQQTVDGGITKFMQRLSNSYTKYFNTKHSRVGPLFQGQFKAVRVQSDEQLLHVSRYIHLNPYTSKVVETTEGLEHYQWSSLKEYLNLARKEICDKELINGIIPSTKEYRQFTLDYAEYAQSLELIKHLIIE